MHHIAVRGTRTENRMVTKVWLGYNTIDHVYNWVGRFDEAYPFNNVSEAEKAALSAKGPWFNQPDMEALEFLLVIYTPATPAKIELV